MTIVFKRRQLAYEIWQANQPFMRWKQACEEADFWLDYCGHD